MSKRFRDTAIWKKQWYRELSPSLKTAWQYITDNCDNVGVWDADFELAWFCIGEHVDFDLLVEKCNKNIEILNNGKWWLIDFCDFQYGELTPKCKPHLHYMQLLKKHSLFKRVCKGLPKASRSLEEKEKDKEKDKEKEEERGVGGEVKTSTNSLWLAYHENNGKLPTHQRLTHARANKCRARLSDPDFYDKFVMAIRLAQDIPFLIGNNDRGWKADFDWFIANDTNVFKVLEGKYSNSQNILTKEQIARQGT